MTGGSDLNSHEKMRIREVIKQHDRYQFETRFDYSLEKKPRKSFDLRSNHTYHMDAYFFIPKQMGMNAATYKKSHFYEDIRPLIRFKEPQFSYQELTAVPDAKGGGKGGPFSKLEKVLERLSDKKNAHKSSDIQEAIDLIKYFSCCYVSNYRRKILKHSKAFKEIMANPCIEEMPSLHSMFGILDPFLQRHFRLLRRFAGLRDRFVLSRDIRNKIFPELLVAEEYCFYRFREGVALMVESVDRVRNIPVPEYIRAKKKLRVWARFICWFENSRHFMPVAEHSTGIERERFLSRLGSIKKYLSSILYLEVKPNALFAIRAQTGYMLAAGIAAFWYFLANLMIFYYLQFGGFSSFGGFHNLLGFGGLTIILSFIAAYVLKDRIKEIGRVRFQSGILGNLPDHTYNIFYRNHQTNGVCIGKVKESVEFVRKLDSVPKEIREIRERSNLWDDESQFSLLFYQKTFELDFSAVKKIEPEFTTVKDITRFSIRRYLTRLDDPIQMYLGLDKKGAVHEMGMPKVYYIGVAVKFFSEEPKGISGFDYQVLVVDKNGLVRIDEIAKSVRIEE